MNRGIAAVLTIVGLVMVALEFYLNSTGGYSGGMLFTAGGTLAFIGFSGLFAGSLMNRAHEFFEQRAQWARLLAGGFLVFAGLAWRFTSDSNLAISAVCVIAGGWYIIKTITRDPA